MKSKHSFVCKNSWLYQAYLCLLCLPATKIYDWTPKGPLYIYPNSCIFFINLCTGILYNLAWNNNLDFFFPFILRHRNKKFLPITAIMNKLSLGWFVTLKCRSVFKCTQIWWVNVHRHYGHECLYTHTGGFCSSLCLFFSISHFNSTPAFPPSCNARPVLSVSPWWQDRNSCNKLLSVPFFFFFH